MEEKRIEELMRKQRLDAPERLKNALIYRTIINAIKEIVNEAVEDFGDKVICRAKTNQEYVSDLVNRIADEVRMKPYD